MTEPSPVTSMAKRRRQLIACVTYGVLLTVWVAGRWVISHGQANDPGWLILLPLQAIAALGMLRCARLRDLEPARRIGWALLAAAFLVDMLAIVDWNAIFMSDPSPLGTSADGLYLANYALLAAACSAFFVNYGGSLRDPRTWLDAAALAFGIAAGLFPLFISPRLAAGSAAEMSTFGVFSYAIGITLSGTALSLLAMQILHWRRERSMVLMAGAICVGLVTDVASISANIRGIFRLANIDDLGSSWAYVLFIGAALLESPSSTRVARHTLRSVHGLLPVFAIFAALSVMVGTGVSSQYRWLSALLIFIAALLLVGREQHARHRLARQYARLAADEAHSRFGELMRLSTDMIVLADTDGRITYISPAAERWLFVASDPLRARMIHGMLGAAHEATLTAMLNELRTAPDGISLEEVNFVAETARTLQIIARLDPINPRVAGIVFTFRDVTEARCTERALIAIAAEHRTPIEEVHVAQHHGTGLSGPPAAGVQETEVPPMGAASEPLAQSTAPSAPQYDALVSALHALVADVNRHYGVSTTLATAGVPSADLAGAHHIYSIARDAIRFLMYGERRLISVRVTCSNHSLLLSIGVEQSRSGAYKAVSMDALALRMIQHRARLLNALLTIDLSGTRVPPIELRVPIATGSAGLP